VSVRYPSPLQDHGRNTGIAPSSISNATVLTERLRDLDECRLEGLQVDTATRVRLSDLGLKIADLLGRYHLLEAGRALGACPSLDKTLPQNSA